MKYLIYDKTPLKKAIVYPVFGVPNVHFTTYPVTTVLNNVTSSNKDISVREGRPYTTKILPNNGYKVGAVFISMGGVGLPNAYDAITGIVKIEAVTGAITITATGKAIVPFNTVSWLNAAYGIGDNTTYAYNGWAPGCARYDSVNNKVLFLQSHASKHGGGAISYNSQLWRIDPYNVMEAELIREFPVALCFAEENGVYYICTKTKVFKSTDNCTTWEEYAVQSAPNRMYGMAIIDGVFYCGDDALASGHNGLYSTSSDFGVTWQTETFDFADDYPNALTCSEANFCKFNGRIYACLRREGAAGLLAVQDNGVWKVISEEMPNVTSDCFMTATDEDVICFSAIDRPNRNLVLGTITIDENDVPTITTDKSFNCSFSKAGDFHTPTYVVGRGFNMVTFMAGGLHNEYRAANNYAIVGYEDVENSQNISYTAVKQTGANGDVKAEPYIGTSPYKDGSLKLVANSVYSVSDGYPNVYSPDENGNIIRYVPNGNYWDTLGTLNVFSNCLYDVIKVNNVPYACLVNGPGSNGAWTGIKVITKAKEKVIGTINPDEVVPVGGVFINAFCCPITTTNVGVFTQYKIHAERAAPTIKE